MGEGVEQAREQVGGDAGPWSRGNRSVGGETLERSWGVLRPGGRLVTVATSGAGAGDPRTRAAFFIVQANREQLGAIARLIDEGQLRPVVDAVFPLAEARRAYEHRATRGKVVLSVTS
jgi:NADPH:quinone reductase-like Zn-dependent oxidoreductase